VLTTSEASIAALAKRSVMTVADYLEIDTSVRQSSLDFPDTYGYDRADRLIAICKQLDGTDYINAIGGQHLYDKQYFAQQGLQLHFLDSPAITYAQFNNEFVPNLSIIDVLMFNSKTQIKAWLADFKLR